MNKVGVSLCSGIGGLDLAVALAGFDIWAQVEIDLFCQAVLRTHAAQFWPNAVIHGDLRNVGRHNLPASPAILFGGIPCQPASHAGRRLGKADDRWLWPEAIRIVKEIQPQVCFFENVSGLRSLDNGNSFREILGSLAEAGFDATWFHLRASDVGAPHQRERIFIVAYAQSSQRWEIDSQISTLVGNGGVSAEREEIAGGAGIGSEELVYADDSRDARTDDKIRAGRNAANSTSGAGTSQADRNSISELAHAESGRTSAGDRSVERGLGRIIARIPSGLDELRELSVWPSRPGQPQFDFEPLRTTRKQFQRAARLKALGNAVVWQVAAPIAAEIYTYLEERDREAGQDGGAEAGDSQIASGIETSEVAGRDKEGN